MHVHNKYIDITYILKTSFEYVEIWFGTNMSIKNTIILDKSHGVPYWNLIHEH